MHIFTLLLLHTASSSRCTTCIIYNFLNLKGWRSLASSWRSIHIGFDLANASKSCKSRILSLTSILQTFRRLSYFQRCWFTAEKPEIYHVVDYYCELQTLVSYIHWQLRLVLRECYVQPERLTPHHDLLLALLTPCHLRTPFSNKPDSHWHVIHSKKVRELNNAPQLEHYQASLVPSSLLRKKQDEVVE